MYLQTDWDQEKQKQVWKEQDDAAVLTVNKQWNWKVQSDTMIQCHGNFGQKNIGMNFPFNDVAN